MNRQEADIASLAMLEEWLPSALAKASEEGLVDSTNQALAYLDPAPKPSADLRLKAYLSRLDH